MPRVVVDVMLKPEILDPAGQAVSGALPRLGVTDVTSVRIGKRIEIEFSGKPDLDRAREIADRLLANPVIEDFTLRVDPPEEPEVPARKAASGQVDAQAAGDPVEPDAPAVRGGKPTPVSHVKPLPPGTRLIPAKLVGTGPATAKPAAKSAPAPAATSPSARKNPAAVPPDSHDSAAGRVTKDSAAARDSKGSKASPAAKAGKASPAATSGGGEVPR